MGEVTDLILDPTGATVLGFEIRSDSGRSYFLPLALTMIPNNGSIVVNSPLHLIEDVEYYRSRGRVFWPQAAPLSVELVGGRVSPATE